jgi:hypothetical protein
MPSGGLIDQPQDAKFYDWHLKDPKDTPFTTFKFHYRSWDNLVLLQLIPDDHPRHLSLPSPSTFPPHHFSDPQESPLGNDLPVIPPGEVQIVSQLQNDESIRDSSSSNNSATPWMTNIFDDSPEGSTKDMEKEPAFSIPRKMKPLPPPSNVPTSRFSEGFKQQLKTLDRPESESLDRYVASSLLKYCISSRLYV